ncbi:hypothetical protein HZB03_01060 [Candidatus Woesearchaeota archaeon]|nr:hypothetical protein [Candidatus Woesearchaeota archaeon]
MKKSANRSPHVLAAAPLFDKHQKRSETVSGALSDLQRKLSEYQRAPSMKEHPQYGLWKVTTALVVLLFLVVIGTSLYTASPTGYATADGGSSNVLSTATLMFVTLLVFGFFVLLFYRQVGRQL